MLKPDEFRHMTPAEYTAVMDGWQWRVGFQQEVTAQWVAQIVNGAGFRSKPIRPEEMLGRPFFYTRPDTQSRKKKKS